MDSTWIQPAICHTGENIQLMSSVAWEMYKQYAREVGGIQFCARNTNVNAWIIMSGHLSEKDSQALAVMLDEVTWHSLTITFEQIEEFSWKLVAYEHHPTTCQSTFKFLITHYFTSFALSIFALTSFSWFSSVPPAPYFRLQYQFLIAFWFTPTFSWELPGRKTRTVSTDTSSAVKTTPASPPAY